MVSEVGSGQVAIFPVFTGFRRAVTSQVASVTTAASQTFQRGFNRGAATAGTTAGRGFKSSFTTASSGLNDLTLKKLQGDVADATKAMASNLLRVQDAQGKVRVATAQVSEATKKWGADSARTIAAQERLATATRNLTAVQDRQSTLTTTLKTAQQQLTIAQDLSSRSALSSLSNYGLLGKGLQGVFTSIRAGASVVANVGSVISNGFSRGIQAAVGVVSDGLTAVRNLATGAAAAAAIGISTALSKGFSRLTGIETAQAKLTAIGLTAQDVAQVMADANDSVIGTQYSLADAVTAASSAVAAGIKPGKQLNDYLKTTVNAAALAGVNLGDLGLVMNQVQAQNKAYTQDLNQVASRGIPIYAGLAKVYGVTQEKLRDMLQSGSIDAAHFQAALKLVAGDAALSIGRTTVGAFQNLGAATSRFGAGFLSGVFPIFRDFFTVMTKGLDAITPAVTAFSLAIGPRIREAAQAGLGRVSAIFDRIKTSLSSLDPGDILGKFKDNLGLIAPIVGGLLGSLGPLLARLPLIGTLFGGISAPLGIVLGLFAALIAASPKLRDSLASALKSTGQTILDQLQKVFEAIQPILPQITRDLTKFALSLIPLIPELGKLLPPLTKLVIDLLPLLPPLVKLTIGVLKLLTPALSTGVRNLSDFASGLDSLIKLMSGKISIGQFLGQIRQLKGTFDSAIESGTAVGNAIAHAAEVIVVAGHKIYQGIISAVNGVMSFLAALPQQIGAFFAALPKQIAYFVGFAIGALLSIPQRVGDVVAQIPGLFFNALSAASQFVSDAVANVGAFFASIPATVAGVVTNVLGFFSRIPAGTQSVIGQVVGFFQKLPGQILASMGNAGKLLLDVGRNIVQGLVDGITGAATAAVKAVKGLGASLLKGIKDGLQIKSPSRRFRDEVGRQIPAGIAVGVLDGKAALNRTVSGLVNVPSVSASGSTSSTTSVAVKGSGRGDVYIDKVVAPDQNPVVSGRVIGREVVRLMAGTPERE